MGAFSFHETKNIVSGEGGMLVINDEQFIKKAEIIREKGTNRTAFYRGEVDKYGWIDVGSSFLPSDIIAAFLYAQLQELESIQTRRKKIWNTYNYGLTPLAEKNIFKTPYIPKHCSNNAHVFFIICKNLEERTALINHLKTKNISTAFHYLSLHKSFYYSEKYIGNELPNSDLYTDCLLRLPFYVEMLDEDIQRIIFEITNFYKKQ
jgi:dTDP-4-amino-4,6-dideoxygalactose transaminase